MIILPSKSHPNNDYIIQHITANCSLLLNKLEIMRVTGIKFKVGINSRAYYSSSDGIVVIDPTAKCFFPNYWAPRYNKFGGVGDLTPAGVFCHECGHGATFANPILIKLFKQLNLKQSPTRYGATRVAEDIAESFRLYCSNPELLKSRWSTRYSILNDVLKFY